MVKSNITYLSYGAESEYRRAIFSILSFSSWCAACLPEIRILVYTDKPGYFEPYLKGLPVEYFLLTPELLEEMLGNTGFIHRRKVAVVDLTFRNFPGEDLLFVDADTFFIADAGPLLKGFETGKSVMHKREYNIEKGLAAFTSFNQAQYPEAFINYISGKAFSIGGKTEHFSKYDYSWNSGVIGLTKDMVTYMPDIYQLTDEFYANSKWFISEQLAFSFILQRTTKIIPADKIVLHYWGKGQKMIVDRLIADLFQQHTAAELQNADFIQSLTKDWKYQVETDWVFEQAVLAFSNQYWYYFTKKVIQLMLREPFNLKLHKKLMNALGETNPGGGQV